MATDSSVPDADATEAEAAKTLADVAPPEQAGASAVGAMVAAAEHQQHDAGAARAGHYRWTICA